MNKSRFYSVDLSATANDPNLATLVSRGSQNGVASRLGCVLQNNNAAAILYFSNKPGGRAADWIKILPSGDLYDSIFTQGDDIYCYSDTASAIVTVREIIPQ